MIAGTLSISTLVDEYPTTICTMSVCGNSFAEIEDEAKKKVKEFREKSKGFVFCCVSVKALLWFD